MHEFDKVICCNEYCSPGFKVSLRTVEINLQINDMLMKVWY